jgi:glutamate racemase
MNDPRPIGVFDSGVGGLTVVRALEELLPHEKLVYVGDTARLPYGNKSAETVTRYSREITRFLAQRNVKVVVVACNTASAFALEALRAEATLPVLGVIDPGVQAALAATRSGRVGIIGTSGTIGSGAYQKLLLHHRPDLVITARATPLLVPLIEENWLDHEVTYCVLREYLRPMEEANIDTLVLACTHYPLLKPALAKLLGQERVLVDSAEACAVSVKRHLDQHGMRAEDGTPGRTELCLTDVPAHFASMARRFLKRPAAPPELVRVESL